ncbi:MAG TPA: hypothetical protein VJH88_05810 [Candidatus Nanoarchaeia archaeon]|nr:hypothetical protein [Candidatus Nanoarchaeia archaeon]
MAKTICFIGVDGAGKGTVIGALADHFTSRNVDVKTYYFGWKPFLPTTRILSALFKKRDYKITEQFNKHRSQRMSIVKEMALAYYFIEYFARYLYVRASRRHAVLLFDRYFYDIYAHYDYGAASRVMPLLLRLFPRPAHLFVLDVAPDVAHQRKPEMAVELLKRHRNHYLTLAQKLKARVVSTDKSVHETMNEIITTIGDSQ